MKERLVQKALEMGFEACRITTADPPGSALMLQRWLQARYHGDMAYLERNAPKRLDPQLVLPGARSVITLAASYALDGDTASHPQTLTDEPSPKPGGGTVARYARFADYHAVLRHRLEGLARFLDAQPGAQTRSLWYVDTGPVLERDLAQRAGLGFIGKHTNLVSRHLGNWFFLAEILTTAELAPDPPEKNRCGTCTRCLATCPTEAFVAPFVLDARRCISYLTIECKGPIPESLRPAVGDRIFGCDDCLEVCPWNRFARASRIMRTAARPDLGRLNLVDLLAWDEERFGRAFSGTPLQRAKRKGLLRNVCVALGNTAGPETLAALEKASLDPEPLIASHARWAMDRIRQRFATGLS